MSGSYVIYVLAGNIRAWTVDIVLRTSGWYSLYVVPMYIQNMKWYPRAAIVMYIRLYTLSYICVNMSLVSGWYHRWRKVIEIVDSENGQGIHACILATTFTRFSSCVYIVGFRDHAGYWIQLGNTISRDVVGSGTGLEYITTTRRCLPFEEFGDIAWCGF